MIVQQLQSYLTYFLALRARQIQREISYLLRKDPFGLVIGVIVIAFILHGVTVLSYLWQGALLLGFLIIGGIFWLHVSRTDTRFLAMLNLAHPALFVLEYWLLALPLALILCFFAPFGGIFFVVILVLLSGIAFIPQGLIISRRSSASNTPASNTHRSSSNRSSSNRPSSIRTLLPKLTNLLSTTHTAYEWQSGLRLRGVLMLVLTIVGITMSHHIWIFWICAALVITQAGEFYGQGESRVMLSALRTTLSPNRLLWFKIQQGILLEMLIIMPFLVCWSMRYASSPVDIGIAAGVSFLFASIFISIAVVSKYAFWKPNTNQTFLVLCMVVWLFVLLWFPLSTPMPQVLAFMIYRKARTTLYKIS
jgi:hypothetical protein